jgi:hypothetical protein
VNSTPEGTIAGVNGEGGFASLGQFHGHFIPGQKRMPADTWKNTATYPANMLVTFDLIRAATIIEDLNDKGIPVNTVHAPGNKFMIFPRKMQGMHPLPEWAGGIAFSELGGIMQITNREAYDLIEPESVPIALHSASRHDYRPADSCLV